MPVLLGPVMEEFTDGTPFDETPSISETFVG